MNFNKLIAECSDYDFKEQLERQKPKSWLKTVSAFANGIGGILFFGVNDNKQLVNINNPQLVCDKISELINSKIDPVPKYIIEPYKERLGRTDFVYIALKIEPGPRTPYYYSSDGVYEAYIRSGNQSIKAPKYILEELILKGQNKTYDSIITVYQKKLYSFTFFEATFLERIHTKITESDYLSFSLMNDDGFLTNAGVLLSDQNIYRHNRIFCTRWNGLNKTSLEEAADDDEYSGGLVKLLDSALNFVKKNTKKKWKKEASGRVEMPEYDEIAIREAIVNAIIHRQYTNVGSEVTIDIYDDRIVITSPGPMVSGMLINKELNNNIPSIRRNPILADIFARMKFMDRRGSGFDKIVNGTNRLFDDQENHVEFYATETHFSVVIYNANYENSDRGTINGTINGIINGTINGIINGTINENEKIIYTLMKENHKITVTEIIEKTNIPRRTINRIIASLKEKEMIDREGSNKGGHWKILK